MPKLVTWMNNQRVGELTKLANGAHTFKYAPEWLASRYARPLSLSLPLQRGNITSDAVFNFFDNLLPDSPIVRDRIVKRYHAKSRQPFDLLSEIGRDSVGAVTLLPENETITRPIMAWEKLTEARLEEVLTAYKADIPLGMIREENDFRISVAGAQEKTALLRIGNDCTRKGAVFISLTFPAFQRVYEGRELHQGGNQPGSSGVPEASPGRHSIYVGGRPLTSYGKASASRFQTRTGR